MEKSEDQRLRRDIGLTGSAFLSFNGIVGAGIFALPATLHLQFGAFSPWLFPIFGLVILLIAIPFARLASLQTHSGGPVAYTATFGPIVSFQTGWLYYLARIAAVAANANVFALYAAALWAPLGTGIGRAATILALVGSLTWINVVGVRRAIRTLDALTLLKAAPLLALALWALAAAGGTPAPGPMPRLEAVEAAALIILYAFIGFENSTVPAAETADATRTIPRALIGTAAATAALYFLIQLAYVAVMPAGASPEAPLAALAGMLAGPAGAAVLTVTVLASVAGNACGAITSTSRVTFALTEQRSLPRWFGRVSARFATPANSVLFMGAAVAALALSGSFVWLAVLSTLARLVVYAASISALPLVDRRGGARMWLVTAAGLAVCVWAAAQSEWKSWLGLAAAVVAGFVLYALARRQAGSSSSASAGTVSSIQPPPSTRSP